jgi:hypothetical protein
MGNKLAYLAVFALGAAAGSCVTWKILKDKYEQIAQEEIDSVKALFKNDNKPEQKEDDPGEQHVEKEVYTQYANNYLKHSAVKEEEKLPVDRPYVISPDEFGEFEDYETISLTYYSDGVIADDEDNVIEEVDDMIGYDSLNHFGEYEDDCVFVRNDRVKCDYEILKDLRDFSDVVGGV